MKNKTKMIRNNKIKEFVSIVIVILLVTIIGFINKNKLSSEKGNRNSLSATKTLASQITGSDYGKSVDYSVTVNGIVANNWKIFHNDGTYVYIIYGDYLPQTLVPQAAISGGLTLSSGKTYSVGSTSRDGLVNVLKTSTYWSEFATGISGAVATGAPTYAQFVASWNANPKVNSTKMVENTEYHENYTNKPLNDTTGLYHPYKESIDNDGCYGYWFATAWSGSTTHIWRTSYSGIVYYNTCTRDAYCARPLVRLPAGVLGKVTESIYRRRTSSNSKSSRRNMGWNNRKYNN